MISPVEVQTFLSLSPLPRVWRTVVIDAPGSGVVYNVPLTLEPLLVLLNQKLSLTALFCICLLWETVGFAADFYFLYVIT